MLPQTDDSSLCNEESQLVLSGLRKLAQLHTMNFGPDKGSDIVCLDFARVQQIREREIGVLAMFTVFERLERGIFIPLPVRLMMEYNPVSAR